MFLFVSILRIGGQNACVWSVNRVLARAGVSSPWGTSLYVPTAKSALDRVGKRLSGPQAGAIVIFQDGGSPPFAHIGVVMCDGKTLISNSSSRGRFQWVASPASYTAYFGKTPLYYAIGF